MHRHVRLLLLLVLTGCNLPQQISNSGKGAYETSIATWQDGLAVTWYDNRHGNAEIYLRLLTANGRPESPEMRLTHSEADSYEPDIETIDDNILIAWYDKGIHGSMQAKLGLWNENGEALWTQNLSSNNSRNPVIHFYKDKIFVAWIEELDDKVTVWSGWWNKQGQVISSPLLLGPAGERTWNLNAGVMDNGNGVVAFDAIVDTQSDELYLAIEDKTGSELWRLTRDDGFPSKYPDIVLSGDDIALTWFDEKDGNQEIYVAVGKLSHIHTNFEESAQRITHTSGESIGAYMSKNGDRYGLAWCDEHDDQFEIYYQTLDMTGGPIEEPQRLTNNITSSLIPAIETYLDGFVMVWNEFIPDPNGIHGPDGRSEIMFSYVR